MEHTKRYEELMAEVNEIINRLGVKTETLSPEPIIETPEPNTTMPTVSEYRPAYADDDYVFPKSLEELRVQTEETTPRQTKPRNVGHRVWHSPIIGVLVYSMMALAVLTVFLIHGSGDGAPRDIFGYSAMRVLTGSMQSEIPQNSLIITRRVDPNTLQVGDDITFFQDSGTVVTHRIVAVHYNYEDTGARAFQTMGIENNLPDPNLVIAGNVIGRVVWSNHAIGSVVTFVQDHLIVSGIMAGMILALFASMRMIFGNKRVPKAKTKRRKYKAPARLVIE